MKAFTLIFLLALATVAASNADLPYGPREVDMRGTIRRQTFPGPPNYEDIAKGDEPETYWILDLVTPTDVVGTPGDNVDSTERGIRSVQLVFDGTLSKKSYIDYAGFVGQPVVVRGPLFHAISGHHKTAVLISVREITKAPNQPSAPTRCLPRLTNEPRGIQLHRHHLPVTGQTESVVGGI